MSKKDFEALAGVARGVRNYMDAGPFLELIDRLAVVCRNANPHFNYTTFKAACYK